MTRISGYLLVGAQGLRGIHLNLTCHQIQVDVVFGLPGTYDGEEDEEDGSRGC